MQYDVVFYVAYPYYYPHFLPIYEALQKEKLSSLFVLSQEQNTELMLSIAKEEDLDYCLGDENVLEKLNAKAMLFAKVPSETLQTKAKKCFLCHGTGTKQCGFEKALVRCDLVFVEGSYRYEYYTQAFPSFIHKIKQVGYSKLDAILNVSQEDKKALQKEYALDPHKKTILYAPTFFPSSIEKMSDTFPDDFKAYNIIVKAHYLSWERSRYKSHIKKFEKWKQFDNCTIIGVEEYNLVPFMLLADLMISDESSAIFEFASLDKPVIINAFLKLRWSYYLNPKKLFKRMDKNMDRYRSIGYNPKSYQEMVVLTHKSLDDQRLFKQEREALAKEVCGTLDGNVSKRIVDEIKEICGI